MGPEFIDAAGKACLTALHRQGAEFVAADCLTTGSGGDLTMVGKIFDSALTLGVIQELRRGLHELEIVSVRQCRLALHLIDPRFSLPKHSLSVARSNS
jgi:hypothetical protein